MSYRQARWEEPLVFELGGREDFAPDFEALGIPEALRREKLGIPRVSEPEVVRHYTRLAEMSFGRDSGFYPLGSCTMKYNPLFCEELAQGEGVLYLHPDQPEETIQGVLKLLHLLASLLAEIGGMHKVSLQPAAGAHGEFVSMLIVRAYHESRGEVQRKEVIVPDSAHGTNPASAAMAGFEVVVVPSDARGRVDLQALRAAVSERTAAMMLTNPNTLGLFEDRILEIVELVHGVGALMFYDGANLNGIMGRARPGDMGFDLVHFNLHKTFGTPHGGGGPGAGPVGVRKGLEDFLPVPTIERDAKGRYYLDYDRPKSIGWVRHSPGSLPVLLKALAYLLRLGGEGLREASEVAVLNANYLAKKLSTLKGLELRFPLPCKHEFVLSAEPLKRETGVGARELAKGLMDFGFHPPTCYFPSIVPEALMIEPTETESKEELDRFAEAMRKLVEKARSEPDQFKTLPRGASVGRVDEVTASRAPVLSWMMMRQQAVQTA
ncbi:MAG: aminomethyl-transferring glycine dehydrogenase subunit GcvPB [Candidatus Hadarchaeales archaeon]